jgi:hypothetical protein
VSEPTTKKYPEMSYCVAVAAAIGYAGLAALAFGIGLRRYQRGETPTSRSAPYWLAWSMAAIFQSPLGVRA